MGKEFILQDQVFSLELLLRDISRQEKQKERFTIQSQNQGLTENSCSKEITRLELDRDKGKKLTKREIPMREHLAEIRRKEKEFR